MAYAELAALRPHAGGEYVYLREAYGPLAGFLSGWTSFVAGFSGAIAASAVVLAAYVGRFLPAAANATPLVTIPLPGVPLVVSRKTLVALAAIALTDAGPPARRSDRAASCRTCSPARRSRRSSRSWRSGSASATAIPAHNLAAGAPAS